MKKTSDNRACCQHLMPDLPTETNEILLFLRDLAASDAGPLKALPETLIPPEGNTVVEDYVKSHFGEEDP